MSHKEKDQKHNAGGKFLLLLTRQIICLPFTKQYIIHAMPES